MAGSVVADTLQDGAGNSTSMDNAIFGSAKAWVNYNQSSTTVVSSYNVSSVTYNSTGAFTVNFINAFVDTNYGLVSTVSYSTAGTFNSAAGYVSGTQTTSSCKIATWNTNSSGSGSLTDFAKVSVWFFR